METIVVRDLHKVYGDHLAADGLSFTVNEGEVFALVGPDGAGKTTTLEILEGQRKRCSGEVSVLGYDPATAGAPFRQRIGIVAQDSGIDEGCTPRELVRRYARRFPNPLPVDEVIELVGLVEKRDARVSTLSGGQRRRVDLALGLVGDPELIFIDEPTAGFDPPTRRRAWDLVATLCTVGKTVLMTTRYMEEAHFLADRIGVIANGRLIATGSPTELASHGLGGTIRFRLPQELTLSSLPDVGSRLTISTDRVVEVQSAHPTRDLHVLTGWAVSRFVELEDLTLAPPRIEETYLAMIGQMEPASRA